MNKEDDALKFVREIIELTKDDDLGWELDFDRKGKPFLSKGNSDIFKAHPDSLKGILFNPNLFEKKEYVKKRKR